jgi:hypothetical protein
MRRCATRRRSRSDLPSSPGGSFVSPTFSQSRLCQTRQLLDCGSRRPARDVALGRRPRAPRTRSGAWLRPSSACAGRRRAGSQPRGIQPGEPVRAPTRPDPMRVGLREREVTNELAVLLLHPGCDPAVPRKPPSWIVRPVRRIAVAAIHGAEQMTRRWRSASRRERIIVRRT